MARDYKTPQRSNTCLCRFDQRFARLRERVAKAATEETGPLQVRAWKLFLSLDKMLFHTSDAKRTNNTSLTKAIRTRIVQIEAGNALEILRQSQHTYAPQRTTKPRTDPTAATDKHNQRDDPTYQVSCGRCRGIISYTSYSRTKDYVKLYIMATTTSTLSQTR